MICEAFGDFSQVSWDQAEPWQRSSTLEGIKAHLSGKATTPEQSHEIWCEEKRRTGWVYGQTKDPKAKTHPCLVPYAQLPFNQQLKDMLFHALIEALRYA